MSYMKHRTMKRTTWMRLLLLVAMLYAPCSMFNVFAQIVIGGNIYGGGNAGNTDGNTKVTVHAGDLNEVYGGARQANVTGNAFVHVDGEHASSYILINKVYGGNDISGTISGSSNTTPDELSQKNDNKIDETWSAFVRISTKLKDDKKTEATDAQKIYIGQLFGGGNGDYSYSTTPDANGNYTASDAKGVVVASSEAPLTEPDLGKTYLELLGGSIVNVFGGGNMATVTQDAVIHVDNPSEVVNHIKVKDGIEDNENGTDILNEARFKLMGINYKFTYPNSDAFQIGNLFGGNNKVDMAIQPRWNLLGGKVRNLYSGGNEGRMTCPHGLLLVIPENSTLKVDNVYGGCRKADVRPLDEYGKDVPNALIQLADNPTGIPAGFSARTRILGGNINNVYGGNDISGNVYGGNTLAILTTIHGDVYGGGNGSYAYTDNTDLMDDLLWSEFYYNPAKVLGLSGDSFTGLQSAEALNKVRPNAEQVSLLLRGKEGSPISVEGSVFVGGNSASLAELTDIPNRQVHVKIGSFVTIDNLFLGNNGANMVKTDEADDSGKGEGVLRTLKSTQYTSDRSQFNSMDLTVEGVFAEYMEGCAMHVMPNVVFDDIEGYEPYSSQFGSFYCGGNVGSMNVDNAFNINFNDKVIIYNKVVGGSNMANVYQSDYNAQYLGGLLGKPDVNGNKLILNFGGLKIQPKRWVDENDKSKGLEWNTVDGRTYNPDTKTYTPMAAVPKGGSTTYDPDTDPHRRFHGGNIYGGCYSNGHVNGNVVINLNASLVDRTGDNAIFDVVEENEGEAKLYDGNYNIKYRNTGVLIGEQGMDPLGRALNVFGGGYGADSEIWGSATINLNAGYTFQIFGGGEQGAIGKALSYEPDPNDPSKHNLTYEYDDKYSTYINLSDIHKYPGTYRGDKDNNDEVIDHEEMAEAEFIYGGSFEGLIAGNTHINLGNGRIFNSFAGSCNADILGHTETYVGRNSQNENDLGFPWIRDHIYGGNDLGGRILGNSDFSSRVSNDIKSKVYNPKDKEVPDVLKASAYTEYIQGRVEYIFGGCYGDYDYTDSHYNAYTTSEGTSIIKNDKPIFFKPWMDNAFVNFKPNSTGRNAVAKIYGAGQGHRYLHPSDNDRDKMQDRSYVLIDNRQDDDIRFINTEVFGAGDYSGVGMRYAESATTIGKTTIPALTPTVAKDNADGVTASTVIDLIRGHLKDVYGASYKEGITRRTIVNVPKGSTIYLNRIFGGAYGLDIAKPCDVFESNVNYHSRDAVMLGHWIDEDLDKDGNLMSGGIYGGNNSARRTLYSRINIDVPVVQNKAKGYTTKVFGAGYGKDTWAQYTEVNLNKDASVYEVYGGGYGGMVLNKQSVDKSGLVQDLPTGYTDEGLNSYLVKTNPLGEKTNTNVYINKGAYVAGYAYGAGMGADASVSGTTYIGLHGGTVNKDVYAAGWGGAVYDKYAAKNFVATTNAYIEGGTLRNVYGGGYEGPVGYHDTSTTATTDDILGVSNVTIGIRKDQAELPDGYGFYKGVPAVQRNAYGAGEGGPVYGSANLTINNGYIGYVHLLAGQALDEEGNIVSDSGETTARYEELVSDATWAVPSERKGRLKDCGNAFGGGYDDKSLVDFTNVTMWGGIIRSSLYGGGEIATVGRGKTKNLTGLDRELEAIYKYGKTRIELFNGHVKRNVFGGGKGYNILGYGGTHELYTDGYVFGQTEVHIHGGEIGTVEGVALQSDGTGGYGNVFGGGDVGYVFGNGYFNAKTIADKAANPKGTTGSPNHWYYYEGASGSETLTEDCSVIISPYLQVRPGNSITYDGKTYNAYDYVPTDYLNTLQATKTNGAWSGKWAELFTGDAEGEKERGIVIHNAVFAGGNVSTNSDNTYANAPTVFGNSTATVYDVYHRDFITIGTEHTGGIYGGGNLSVVDGYRELNITNYGTDYYGLDTQITLAEYQKLTNRERAYFQLEYQCQQEVEINGHPYHVNDRISEEDYEHLPNEYKTETYWKQFGFCSIYAGRLLNTIQRADFCGVYGSRMVLQGAKDRVVDSDDKTEYTINRVGEVSLNVQKSVASDTDSNSKEHGNYFGIYSVVNYLGNLTSDVKFDDDYLKYNTQSRNGETVTNTNTNKNYTYYDWKTERLTKRDRNNGTCHNQVALASGVFLELTTENSTPAKKDYGYITGIVELDLINVKKDIEGGGYVYAKNEHGVRTEHQEYKNVLLSAYNKQASDGSHIEARTHKRYTYHQGSGDDPQILDLETSGNFIHKTKRIVDDCYPNNGVYRDGYVQSPAHYWFIKGEVYIYDQVVSAYAGSASAYSKEVRIPLTITAGSNGKLQLLNVQENRYAYYGDYTQTTKMTADGVKVNNESETYHLNDVITWWDWNQLPANEQKYFVKETYVNIDTCSVNGVTYPTGTYAMLPNDVASFNMNSVLDKKGKPVEHFEDMFRTSNNISHNTGYVLTLDMNSPKDWDDWYSPISGSSTYTVNGTTVTTNRKRKEDYNSSTDAGTFREGPTFRLKEGQEAGLYGQRDYEVGEIIAKEVYDDYTTTVSTMTPQPTGQASVDEAYVAKVATGNVQAGNAKPKSEVGSDTNYEEAFVCVNTIQLGEEDFILRGELVGLSQLSTLASKYMTYNNNKSNTDDVTETEALEYVQSCLTKAYICKTEGKYGGQYFKSGENYSALKSWCSLTDDRDKFEFNYDALDVLSDPTYSGNTSLYRSPYSDIKPVEYTAVYTGTGSITYTKNGTTYTLTSSSAPISREDFENYIPNEQLHYTRLKIDAGSDQQDVYIAKDNFIHAGVPFAKGQDLTKKEFDALDDDSKNKVETVTFNKESTERTVYYCYEGYTPSSTSTTITPISGTFGSAGSVISESDYRNNVPNLQKDFVVQGMEPTETTTLYVSRESNAKDVTSEKVITVVYQYNYYEADDEGEGVSYVNELHVVNIHLQLESGVPEIGPLNAPPTVLPGTPVGMKAPSVNPGLYEIISNGWEMYTDESDAEHKRNGQPFTNNSTKLYWYQNEKVWVAFYSRTYLGKTYSNPVPISVANYHDLDDVMLDKEHHMYVDHPGVMRNSKIYLDNRDCESDATKSELDLLKDFFDLSLQTSVATEGATKDHALLNSRVKGGNRLEFILNSNISPKAYTDWTPIGDDTQCFEGNLHGDGHTISGLNKSLFGKLCGSVYNLGVTGSFTTAGVADTGDGFVENCWISTTGSTPQENKPKAVFGDPTTGDFTPLVNCYYPESNAALYADGLATKMPDRSFYNGEVAYDLNGFYLAKRYYDNNTSWTGEKEPYLYLTVDDEGKLPEQPATGNYPKAFAYYQPDMKVPEGVTLPYLGYVENRFYDGDFRYAGGTIPEGNDDRMRVIGEGTDATAYFATIWPDDYLFFGQMLTYGYDESNLHQETPSRIYKQDNRIPYSKQSNRVYRAPAYFRSKEKSVVHYNPQAYLAAYSAPKTVTDTDLSPAYPNMTAVDFAGHNDIGGSGSYKQGWNSSLFFEPLLDDDGLIGVSNNGETPNLLVYAPAETATNDGYANKATYDVLNNYFIGSAAYRSEPVYEQYTEAGSKYDDGKTYGRIYSASTSSIRGHLVQSDLTTTTDHLLVDKRDFNCPITYTMGEGYRMWYQRTPDNFVTASWSNDATPKRTTMGWEGVSLPFTTEIVATQDKGELTHFYQGSTTGHEYWLRELDKNKEIKQTDVTGVMEATFNPLAKGSNTKKYQNTFLWDYYYSKDDYQDKNTDKYQEQYYSEDYLENLYPVRDYPYSQGGKPYLIGFPGSTYYEFDLSGNWTPKHRYLDGVIASPGKQIVTFVSPATSSTTAVTIGVSDDETGVTVSGYTFKPSYLNDPELESDKHAFLLNNDGNSYVEDDTPNTTVAKVTAFRPYFTAAPSGGSARSVTRSIVFSSDQSELKGVEEHGDPSKEEIGGGLNIYAKKHLVVVTSNLHLPTDVRIVNTAGITLSTFTIEPGETIETRVNISGIYIVQTADGVYTKKLSVR